MSLLSDIQTAVADDSVTLTSALRKCQILAARLKYSPLKEWVACEANGYPANAELPEYQVMTGVPSKADFIGFTHKLSNYTIPADIVPDREMQVLMQKMTLRDSVAEYEAMLAESRGHPGAAIKSPWPSTTARVG